MTACKLLWCQFIHVLGAGSYFYVNEVIAQKLKMYGTKRSNIVKRLLSNLSFVEIVLATMANTLDFICEFGSSGIQGALFLLFQNYCFGQSGERLTTRLRLLAFQNLLRQDVAYFDDPHHATGALTARLASDAAMVKTVSSRFRAVRMLMLPWLKL